MDLRFINMMNQKNQKVNKKIYDLLFNWYLIDNRMGNKFEKMKINENEDEFRTTNKEIKPKKKGFFARLFSKKEQTKN